MSQLFSGKDTPQYETRGCCPSAYDITTWQQYPMPNENNPARSQETFPADNQPIETRPKQLSRVCP